MKYYSNAGPKGPLWHCDAPDATGVHESPDGDTMPIGTGYRIEPDRNGLALFRLAIGGRDIGGRWRLIGREFTPAK
jgi:hypothetical protein